MNPFRRARRSSAGPDDGPDGRSHHGGDPTTNPSRRARGQATVELALMLPLVALLVLAAIQVGLLVRTRILVTHAAREAVREAAVGRGDDEVGRAALAAGGLVPGRLSVRVVRRSGRAVVTLHYEAGTDVPLVGAMLGDVGFDAAATMRLEG
ncbi:MAG: TadE/TadG family type IV pilus assembly protein [Acidimicrobiales bacterium]